MWRARSARTASWAAGQTELLVLPNADEPRLLVPAGQPDSRGAGDAAVQRALSTCYTVKRLGVSGLLRSRAVGAFPDRISISERAGSIRSYLEDVLGEPVDFSLGLGTARANRKTVLQVFDTRGRSLAFVKIADNTITETLVQAEAAALRRLAEADLPAQLEVPRLLHFGGWEGATVIVMTALDTSFLQRPTRQFDLPATEMAAFHRAFAEPGARSPSTRRGDSLVETQASLQPSAASECLDVALTGSLVLLPNVRYHWVRGTVTGPRGT